MTETLLHTALDFILAAVTLILVITVYVFVRRLYKSERLKMQDLFKVYVFKYDPLRTLIQFRLFGSTEWFELSKIEKERGIIYSGITNFPLNQVVEFRLYNKDIITPEDKD